MTHSPTPAELLALRTGNAALLNSPDSSVDIVATIVFALGSAGLLMDPEKAQRFAELEADRAKAPWGRGEDGRPLLPEGRHWTDVPELVNRTVAGIQARVGQAQSGHWYLAPATETWRAPGTVCTRVDGYPRTVGQFTNVLPADLELVLHAHDDLSWCLEMLAKLGTRVAELETAAEAVPLAQQLADSAPDDVSPQVQKLRALIAGQRAAVEDPHDSPLHHTYAVCRDLPEVTP